MPTPKRHVRCEDELWFPAMAKAQRLGLTLSAVIRVKLAEFLDEPETPKDPPHRSTGGGAGSGETGQS